MLAKRKNVIINRSNKAMAKARQAQWRSVARKIVFWLLLVIFIGVAGWLVFFSPVMQVVAVNVVNERIEQAQVESMVKDQIAGKYLGFLPKNNLLLVPTEKISQVLKNNFKLVKEVNVSRVFPNALLVQLQERSSEIIWCRVGDCFLVDQQGEVFYQLKATDEELNDPALVRVDDSSQSSMAVGDQLISAELVGFLQQVRPSLQEAIKAGIVANVATPSAMAGEFRVRTEAGWEIFLNTNESLQSQTEILKKVIQEKVTPERVNQLRYVDLRLKGRVVYRFNDEPEQQDNPEQIEEENLNPQPTEPVVQPEAPKTKKKKDKD